jgi:nitrate/nitrite transporter NarK
MGVVRGFFAFWYDFIVGDDWRIAAAVVLVTALAGLAAAAQVDAALISVGVAVTVIGATFASVLGEARRRVRGR